jgi:hypothetical protein
VTPVVEPRLAARVRVAEWLTTVSTLGVGHMLSGLVAQYPDATPLVQPGVQEGLQTSVQMSVGAEISLPERFSLSATGFVHDYYGLPDVTAPCVQARAEANASGAGVGAGDCVTPSVGGRAYGLEVLLRRAFTERFSVWIAYTLSRSTREARPVAPVGTGQTPGPDTTILSEYDRTHVLSAVASYDFGNDWRAGGRVFAYSGRPYTASAGPFADVPLNSSRLPGFYRIDVRLEKAWTLRAGADDEGRERIAVVLEGVNVTLNKEAVSATCARGSCTIDRVGPIAIPSIGVEGRFR